MPSHLGLLQGTAAQTIACAPNGLDHGASLTQGLAQAQSILDTLASNVRADVVPTRKAFEATNMLTIASAVVAAARARTESRGCHRRTDVDDPSDEWLRHLTATLHNGHMEVA